MVPLVAIHHCRLIGRRLRSCSAEPSQRTDRYDQSGGHRHDNVYPYARGAHQHAIGLADTQAGYAPDHYGGANVDTTRHVAAPNPTRGRARLC